MSEDSRSVHSYEVGDASKGGAEGREVEKIHKKIC